MNHPIHDIHCQCYSRFGSCVNYNRGRIVPSPRLQRRSNKSVGRALRTIAVRNKLMNPRITQDTVHAIRANHGPISIFQRHDCIVCFHTSDLACTESLCHDICGRDHTRSPRGSRKITRLLQRRVVVGELPNAPTTHNIGTGITHVK